MNAIKTNSCLELIKLLAKEKKYLWNNQIPPIKQLVRKNKKKIKIYIKVGQFSIFWNNKKKTKKN